MAEQKADSGNKPPKLHSAEWNLIQHIRQVENGIIEVKIADGLPIMSQRAIQKMKYI